MAFSLGQPGRIQRHWRGRAAQLGYDGSGRRVAHRVVGDPAWSCTAYDARGRVTSEADWSAKTSVFDHSSPAVLTTAFPDSSGTARTTKATSDWLGRPSAYTDEHGTRTRRSYDLPGRLAATYRAGGLPVAPTPPPPSPCEVPGPDAGGYTCNTTAYSWADTTGATTVALSDDSVSAAIALPFAFSWYGQPKTTVSISSNGLMCFTTSGCTSYTPPPPPDPAAPNDLMACFWEDLNPGAGGAVKYKTTGIAPNRAMVVEFNAVPHYSTSVANTFQLQLKENGEAACMYQSVASDGDSSPTAVGIEDAAGTTGLRYRYAEFSATATGVAFSPSSPDSPAATGEVELTQHSYDSAGRLSSLTDKVSGPTGWSPPTLGTVAFRRWGSASRDSWKLQADARPFGVRGVGECVRCDELAIDGRSVLPGHRRSPTPRVRERPHVGVGPSFTREIPKGGLVLVAEHDGNHDA